MWSNKKIKIHKIKKFRLISFTIKCMTKEFCKKSNKFIRASTDSTIYLTCEFRRYLRDSASSRRDRNRNEIIELDLEQKRSWFASIAYVGR